MTPYGLHAVQTEDGPGVVDNRLVARLKVEIVLEEGATAFRVWGGSQGRFGGPDSRCSVIPGIIFTSCVVSHPGTWYSLAAS